MRPETQSKRMLGATRSQAKMYEYAVPEEHHIKIPYDPARLFPLTIGLLGEYAATLSQDDYDETVLNELKNNLKFSAHFFDSYLESKLNRELDPYLLLLGSSAYYLCDLPGSSKVLADRLGEPCPDLDAEELEDLLLWLLQGDWGTYYDGSGGMYGKQIDRISQRLSRYFNSGNGKDGILSWIISLRERVYNNGSARQLLFADVISAIVRKRIENSTWSCLPRYTNLPIEQWREALRKRTFIRELWPAQHLLGTHGVFRGRSAIVQMPTSAGKTRATEIILRSAFASGRTSFAIIVAPFRALCHEIKNGLIDAFRGEDISVNELPDVLQKDYLALDFYNQIFTDVQTEDTETSQHVLVVTPEKCVYMLRQSPELVNNIGLIIYDEGHQFDSGKRGITYELLLTTLKSILPEHIQTVLVSAVITNAEDVGQWLIGESGEIVTGADLIPTYRTVAFASLVNNKGRTLRKGWLRFVNPNQTNEYTFFVPRVIEEYELKRRKALFPKRESKDRGKEISLYLGLKLVGAGSVAIFCGRKDTAAGLCKTVVNAYKNKLPIPKPIEYSNQDEIKRLHYLHQCNLSFDAIATQAAKLGVFAHHSNIPQGIRLAVEHAMKEGFAKFVVCTSTLAQGVNLPIRYLIVTSLYQGRKRITARDFNNLLGRAGRSGIHTEGSVLFANPEVYDKRSTRKDGWRWNQVKELLEPSNSEPCVSTLLSIFQPLYSDDGSSYLRMEPLELVQDYVDDPGNLESLISDNSDENFTQGGLRRQVEWNLNIISSIESYLLAHWDDNGSLQEENVRQLAMGTFAYFLADEEQKINILGLFVLLAKNIEASIPEARKRKVYGRTLYGVLDAISIENWVSEHVQNIIECNNNDELLTTLWPIICQKISNKSFLKCDHPEVLIDIAEGWISGEPFCELLEIVQQADARIIWGTKRRNYKVEHIVDLCENAFGYEGTLVVGAIVEMLNLVQTDNREGLIERLEELQRQLRYGLASAKAITLYEMGFSDRVVAAELSSILNNDTVPYRDAIASDLRGKERKVREVLDKYPAYFSARFDALV